MRRPLLAAVWGVVLATSSCGTQTTATATSTTPTSPTATAAAPAPDPPPPLVVTCRADGITFDAPEVAAAPDGVHLSVSSSLPPGAYLTYASSGGPAGGDAAPADPTTWTMPLPPGDLELGCDVDGGRVGSAAHVLVTDPGGYWRGDHELTAAGCGAGPGTADWVAGLGGTGATAQEAVDGVLAAFTRLLPATYAARPVAVGYLAAATQTWVATRDGRASMTIEVTADAAAYTARPGSRCGP